jgi:RNA polymerase sigma-B factor
MPCASVRARDRRDVPSANADIGVLFERYAASRDATIRDRLVEIHLALADRCARRYYDRGESSDDLVQVARTALLRAVDRFDPARGIPFEAFALPTIVGELRHHFRDNCWIVGVPRRAKDLRTRVFRVSEQLAQQLGREPTAAEIASVLDIDPDHVALTIETNRHYRVSSWEALTNGMDSTALSVDADDDTSDESADRIDVARLVGQLDERLRQVVVWRFYEGCTQREIGARLGVGQVQVSRLLRCAIDLLRHRLSLMAEPGVAA